MVWFPEKRPGIGLAADAFANNLTQDAPYTQVEEKRAENNNGASADTEDAYLREEPILP